MYNSLKKKRIKNNAKRDIIHDFDFSPAFDFNIIAFSIHESKSYFHHYLKK